MCYDAKSSLTGFLVGGSASLYLLLFSKNNTYRHVSLFFLVVVFIQLAEYFMWIDQNCKKNYNNIASRSVILILCLQLFSLVFGGYIFNTTILPNYVMKYASIIFGGFTIYYFYYLFFNNNYNWCTKPNEDKSLQWANFYKIVNNNMINVYYYIFTIVPFLLKDVRKGFLLYILGIHSYLSTRFNNKNTSNSHWCFYSAFVPTIFLTLDLNGL